MCTILPIYYLLSKCASLIFQSFLNPKMVKIREFFFFNELRHFNFESACIPFHMMRKSMNQIDFPIKHEDFFWYLMFLTSLLTRKCCFIYLLFFFHLTDFSINFPFWSAIKYAFSYTPRPFHIPFLFSLQFFIHLLYRCIFKSV